MTALVLKRKTKKKLEKKFTICDLHFIALIGNGLSTPTFGTLIDQLAFDGAALNKETVMP